MNGTDFRTDAALTSFILDQAKELLATGAYVGRDLFPVTPVQRRSGRVWYNKLDVLRVEDDTRTAGSIGPMGSTEGAYLDYTPLKQHSYSAPVIDEELEELADAGIPLDLQQDRQLFALTKCLLAREQRMIDIVKADASFLAGQIDTVTAARRWDRPDLPDSNPLKDIDAMIALMTIRPSHISIPRHVQDVIAGHWCFVDLQKQFRADLLTDGGLPPVIRKMKVLTPGGTKLTTAKGITDVLGKLWTDDVVLFYQGGATAANRVWGWGRTLTYKVPEPMVAETWRNSPEGITFYRSRDKGSAEHLISTACAGVIRKTVTAV